MQLECWNTGILEFKNSEFRIADFEFEYRQSDNLQNLIPQSQIQNPQWISPRFQLRYSHEDRFFDDAMI